MRIVLGSQTEQRITQDARYPEPVGFPDISRAIAHPRSVGFDLGAPRRACHILPLIDNSAILWLLTRKPANHDAMYLPINNNDAILRPLVDKLARGAAVQEQCWANQYVVE